ncbi:hypothetical protein [Ferrithrix thermotolerans]|uniref:hypothetical protein n=1 Tax=Ferrithrix thermotolerans TaxID=209649 RepID=UPI0015BC0B86|nr:hypothetical protein [Ferrithrix thermotolerans]
MGESHHASKIANIRQKQNLKALLLPHNFARLATSLWEMDPYVLLGALEHD